MTIQDPSELRERLEGKTTEAEGLPPTTVIEIDVKGTHGRRYVGRFTYKVPTLGDQIAIGQLKSIYLPQGAVADQNATFIVEQISYLEVTLAKEGRPAWYKPTMLYDGAPIGELYRRALDYERSFHGADKVGNGDTESAGGGDGSDGEDIPAVGRKVQPAAKRSETLMSNDKGST